MSGITKKKTRIVSQKKKRTLTMESAIVVFNFYTAPATKGQDEVIEHFKGTQIKINRPKLRALLNGDGFKDWEAFPEYVEARSRARAKADRQNRNGPRPRTPDAADDVLTFNSASPASVHVAKMRIDEAWCRFTPSVRELAARKAARDAGGDPAR